MRPTGSVSPGSPDEGVETIAMSSLPPYRSLPERFCAAAITILVGVLALRWALHLLTAMAVPIGLLIVPSVLLYVGVRLWRRRTEW